MAPQDTKDVARQLESARTEMIALVSSLTEEQARTRPAPDRWSVLECLEHVCYVERRFLRMVRESEAGRPAECDATKEAALMENVTDRSNRRTAPETVHPFGRCQSIFRGCAGFQRRSRRTLRFASEEGVNLLSRSARHRVFGPLNGVETLLLIGCHGRRIPRKCGKRRGVGNRA